MRYLWSRFIITVLMVEGLAFVVYYNYGPRGIRTLRELKNTRAIAQSDIEKMQNENDDLCDQIDEWENGLFLQEKFARENLALQKEKEIIYFR